MNDINFIKTQGGLNKPIADADNISGLLFYSSTLPSGFSSGARVKQILDLKDAEAKGITTGETTAETKASGGAIEVTAAGTEGEEIIIGVSYGSIEEGIDVELGRYTIAEGDDADAIMTELEEVINDNTSSTGFEANYAEGKISLTAPAGLGATINGDSHIRFITAGTSTATVTQFSGGVNGASAYAIIHYHVKEFFRINKGATLYVGIFAIPESVDFSELITMQSFAEGTIKQFGIYYTEAAYATSQVSAIQTQVAALETAYRPVVVLYQPDIADVSDLTTLGNLRALTAPGVAVLIGQDGNNLGKDLFDTNEITIGCLGAALGLLSKLSVQECLGYVEKSNVSDGSELETPAFGNGDLIRDDESGNLRTALSAKGYIFVDKYTDYPGSYYNDSHTAITLTSDYQSIEANRVWNKAMRGIRTKLLPKFKSNVDVDTSGKLSYDFVKHLETLAQKHLDDMQAAGEISATRAYIDPDQDVVTTSKLIIEVEYIPTGVIRQLDVYLGPTSQIV